MGRVYRAATVRKFCARYGLTIKWQHELEYYRVSYKSAAPTFSFIKNHGDGYWELRNGGCVSGMQSLRGMYTALRGRRLMFDHLIGFTIDGQGRETFFIGWTGREFMALGRPEDLPMFEQGFNGDMPVGVFRDWLIDGGYLNA